MAKLVEVARTGQIPPEHGLNVRLDARNVALFNVDGDFFAVEGECIRCASLLASGTVAGVEVACPACGWRYDVTTGRLPEIPKLHVDTFVVEVIGSRILVCNPYG